MVTVANALFRVRAIALLFATLVMSAAMVVLPMGSPAHAASNTITIVASGGSAEGTNWSYSAGVITASADVSINASDVVTKLASGALVVDAANILVNGSIIGGNHTNSLTLRAENNIIVDAGVTVSTEGGDIVFQSDSDASGGGAIRLGISATSLVGSLDSGGGDIILSGGLNPLTGYAMASSGNRNGTSPIAGVASFGFNVQAGGGDIVVRGSGSPGLTVTARAILFEGNTAGRTVLETSGSGSISVTGDGSQLNQGNAWGVAQAGITMRTVNGPITITGKADTRGGNARGITASNATFASTSGDVTLTDTTDGTSSNYNGLYVGSTLTDISTMGSILIRTDEYISDGTLSLAGPSATLSPFTSSSFTSALPVGRLTATNCQNLVIGKSGNTSNINFAFPVSVGGSATAYGAAISFGAAFSATSSLSVFASGAVTQSAAVTVDALALVGSGTFTLTNASNNARVLAAGSSGSRTGAVSFTDSSGGLSVGQVGSLTGVYSSAGVDIATVGGNLTLQHPVSSSAATGDSVKLYADKGASAGSAGNGNLILSGSGSVSVASGARALLYSGTRAASTGLLSEVGGEANARSLVDATTSLAAISPALASTGEYALFRTNTPVPTYTVTFDANGGSGNMSSQSASNATALDANAFTRSGYTFAGWNTNQFGTGTPYADGASFPFAANETLYAQWSAVPSPAPSPNTLPDTGGSSDQLTLGAITLITLGILAGALAIRRRRRFE